MSLAEAILPHLPYLRRYARALTGSQARGDGAVAATLEAIVGDPSRIDLSDGIRIGLYRAFTDLAAGSAKPGEDRPAEDWEARTRDHLAGLAPFPRQAFLLVAVEEFSAAEAARILRVDREVLGHLVGVAARDLADQLRTTVLIIEDEPLIAMDLDSLVGSLGHTVIGIARTRREAVALAAGQEIGLILADIQLADGSSGIDAVNDLLGEKERPVVFITAFPERLLTGAKPEPAFLVTKPFQTEMVEALIAQALFFDEKARAAR